MLHKSKEIGTFEQHLDCEESELKHPEIKDEEFFEGTFFEIQYMTYDEREYCGDIRRMSKPEDIVFTHNFGNLDTDVNFHECIDYISTKDSLWMSIQYNYNDTDWDHKE